jgi:hypothetical protein
MRQERDSREFAGTGASARESQWIGILFRKLLVKYRRKYQNKHIRSRMRTLLRMVLATVSKTKSRETIANQITESHFPS